MLDFQILTMPQNFVILVEFVIPRLNQIGGGHITMIMSFENMIVQFKNIIFHLEKDLESYRRRPSSSLNRPRRNLIAVQQIQQQL